MDRIEGHLVIPTDAPPTRRRRGSSTTSRPRSSTSASTTCARAAASRSRCARRSRPSPSSAWSQRTIAVFGIGCYTAFSNNLDVEVLQALHGRAPSLATGVKRAKPDTVVFTVQGDGDMVNEGLQEVLHAAARGENITCFMLEQRRVRRDRRPHDRHHRRSASAPRTRSTGATPTRTATRSG